MYSRDVDIVSYPGLRFSSSSQAIRFSESLALRLRHPEQPISGYGHSHWNWARRSKQVSRSSSLPPSPTLGAMSCGDEAEDQYLKKLLRVTD